MIELKEVSFSYIENQPVIDDLTVKFKEGEITALFGFNGSGKSTLLHLIAGKIIPDMGSLNIKLNKKLLNRNELLKQFEAVVLMNQDYKLKLGMTVLENLNYALINTQENYKRKRIKALIEHCELNYLLDRKPNQLSGGQEQRVAFACAISTEPSLILMDEPFSNLDISTRTEFLSFVKNTIKKTKSTLIMVSHDPQDTFTIADKLLILQKGKIAQYDNPIKVYKKPKNIGVANQFGIINQFSGAQLEILTTSKYHAEQTYGIWPENIKIKKIGIPGIVKNIYFKGNHHLLMVNIDETSIYVCDFKTKYQIDEKIFLQFDGKNLILFDQG